MLTKEVEDRIGWIDIRGPHERNMTHTEGKQIGCDQDGRPAKKRGSIDGPNVRQYGHRNGQKDQREVQAIGNGRVVAGA